MKTYTKQVIVENPRLIIWNDGDSYSPRHDDTLGYFITQEGRHNSPDQEKWLIEIVKETGDEVTNSTEHMRLIKERVETELGHHEKVVTIFPVYKYEHGGVSYHLGSAKGFDVSNCGFYIVTEAKMKMLGIKKKDIEKFVTEEIARYTQWVNGEVWGYTLFDSKGDEIECVGSFYSLEDIHMHLCDQPDGIEWKDERLEDYITQE